MSVSGGVSNYNWAAIQSRYQLGNREGIGTSHCPQAGTMATGADVFRAPLSRGGGGGRDPPRISPLSTVDFTLSSRRGVTVALHGQNSFSNIMIKNDRFNY